MTSAPEADEITSRGLASGDDHPRWPEGTVRALVATDLVTAPTRKALRSRLECPSATAPRWFLAHEFATLAAVCARLVPQDRAPPVDIAGAIDSRLSDGRGDGWRYAEMPADGEAHRRGLRGLDETSCSWFGSVFRAVEPSCQDAVLLAVQRGETLGETWRALSPHRYFEELLADVVDVYYAHPFAQEEIGYVGMADARGWRALGLNERAPHEPSAVANGHRGSGLA